MITFPPFILASRQVITRVCVLVLLLPPSRSLVLFRYLDGVSRLSLGVAVVARLHSGHQTQTMTMSCEPRMKRQPLWGTR